MSGAAPYDILVVDDERYARQRLVELLDGRDVVASIACADSGQAAIDALQSSTHDLVFLDVQMPERTGLEVIDTIGPARMPVTIFVTAYDRYTLDAFERAALDYLLKPFDNDRFEQSFQRALKMLRLRSADALTDQLRCLLDASAPGAIADTVADTVADAHATRDHPDGPPARTPSPDAPPPQSDAASAYLKRITVDLPGKVRVVPVETIRYVTAEDAYVKLHTEDDTYLVRERMHVLEDRLNPADFVRIHRSTIVRIDLIETVLQRSGGKYAVRLRDRTKLTVSRSRHDDLLRRLQNGATG